MLRKTIAMVHDENTTLIIYEVLQTAALKSLKLSEVNLELLPLISARGYHSLQHSYNNIFWDARFENGIFQTHPFDGAPIFLFQFLVLVTSITRSGSIILIMQ